MISLALYLAIGWVVMMFYVPPADRAIQGLLMAGAWPFPLVMAVSGFIANHKEKQRRAINSIEDESPA
jgi:hypothetical protein